MSLSLEAQDLDRRDERLPGVGQITKRSVFEVKGTFEGKGALYKHGELIKSITEDIQGRRHEQKAGWSETTKRSCRVFCRICRLTCLTQTAASALTAL
jgi:hypothetical protein